MFKILVGALLLWYGADCPDLFYSNLSAMFGLCSIGAGLDTVFSIRKK